MPNVLVVDDDTTYLNMMEGILKGAGYEVRTSTDPLEAIRALGETPIQCVLLDYRMPQMDGEDVLHLMHLKRPEVPVILCTGFEETQDGYFLEQGAQAVIHKPFDRGALLNTIKSAIDTKEETTMILITSYNLRRARETVLRKLIIKALDKTGFNVSQAAQLLGVSRQSLFTYMKRFSIPH